MQLPSSFSNRLAPQKAAPEKQGVLMSCVEYCAIGRENQQMSTLPHKHSVLGSLQKEAKSSL